MGGKDGEQPSSTLVVKEPNSSLSFQCPMLTSTNYTIWRIRMEVILGIQGVMDVVEGGTNDARQNNIVKGLLFQAIPEDLVLQVGNLKTGKEVWDAIQVRNQGADRVKEARLQTLLTEFEGLKMKESSTIDEYASKISGIASKSTSLGESISETKQVKKFLTSLPKRFLHIVAALEQVLDLKTVGFEDIVGRLKAYEERIKDESKASDDQGKLLFTNTEYSNNGDSGSGRGRGRGQGQGQGRGRGNNQQDYSKNQESQRQNNRQNEKRDMSKIKCYRCDKYGHFVSRCPDRFKDQEANLNETEKHHEEGVFYMMSQEKGMIFLNEENFIPPKRSESGANEEDMWYLDNGASNHMTGKVSYFWELNKNIIGRVKFGDGSYVKIEGMGSIMLEGKNGEQKLLKDIYYIPSLQSNVISLGQATIFGCDIRMNGNLLLMRDKQGKLLMKVPRSENRLYKVRLKTVCKTKLLIANHQPPAGNIQPPDSGDKQRADPLTKALARVKFAEMRTLLGVKDLSIATQKFRG